MEENIEELKNAESDVNDAEVNIKPAQNNTETNQNIENTLIVSPPGKGKTTILGILSVVYSQFFFVFTWQCRSLR